MPPGTRILPKEYKSVVRGRKEPDEAWLKLPKVMHSPRRRIPTCTAAGKRHTQGGTSALSSAFQLQRYRGATALTWTFSVTLCPVTLFRIVNGNFW